MSIERLIESVLTPIANPNPSGDMSYATHSGVLSIGGIDMKVYRLSTGVAVIDSDDMHRLLGGLLPDGTANKQAAA